MCRLRSSEEESVRVFMQIDRKSNADLPRIAGRIVEIGARGFSAPSVGARRVGGC
jgi:hypothetical protein